MVVASKHDRRRASRATVRPRSRGGAEPNAGLRRRVPPRGGSRDAHLVGLPRRRPCVQAQEACTAALRRLRDRRPPPRHVPGGDPAQPPARPARVHRGQGCHRRARRRGPRGRSPPRRARLRRRDAPLRRGADARGAREPRRRALPSARRSRPAARGVPCRRAGPRWRLRDHRPRARAGREHRDAAGARTRPRVRASDRRADALHERVPHGAPGRARQPARRPAGSATATATSAPSMCFSNRAWRSSTAWSSTLRCV